VKDPQLIERSFPMLVIVTYDIPNDRRRNWLSILLEGQGRRVQKSVFECFISGSEMKKLYDQVKQRINPAEDNVRFYWIAADCLPKTLTIGSAPPEPPPKLYII
jgi:CRISPR-associated protein Cas2